MSIDDFFGRGPTYFFEDDPWMYYTDVPYPKAPDPNLDPIKFRVLMESFPKIVTGYHRCIKALIDTGNNVIADHGFQIISWAKEFIDLMKEDYTYLIGVKCSAEELDRREAARGDRPIGMAGYQQQVVHRKMKYDFDINTEGLTAKESAATIYNFIMKNPEPKVIATLKI